MSPIYKHGKQNNIMSFATVEKKVLDTKLSISEEAFFWLLYYCGVRKSEGFERVAEDFKVTDKFLIVDFHQRKKNGATVDPLKLPLTWPGVDKIVECVKKAKDRKPITKTVFISEPTGEVRTTPKGKTVPVKKRVGKRVKASWVFPHIQSTHAWDIVKKVLGEKHYPHFLRLNRLSDIGSDPTANLLRLKSFSGIKSVRVLSEYLGTSEKEQDEALSWMDKQIKKKQP